MLRLPRRVISVTAFLSAAALCSQSRQAVTASPHISAIRFWSFSDVTRIAIETIGDYKVTTDRVETPPRLVFDLHGLLPPTSPRKGVQTFAVGDHLIRQIRVAETEPSVSRIVFDLEVPVEFASSQLLNPDRLMIEVRPKNPVSTDTLVSRSRQGVSRASDTASVSVSTAGSNAPHSTSGALKAPGGSAETAPSGLPKSDATQNASHESTSGPVSLPEPGEDDTPPKSTLTIYPDGVVAHASVTGHSASAPALSTPQPESAHPPVPVTSASDRAAKTPNPKSASTVTEKPIDTHSLVRVFGLKIHKVVLDAGHGGYDTGTIGPKGLMEKDLVLDVTLRLGKLIEERLGAQVVYTRSNDTFVQLERRTAIANEEKADLFISIHANSSPASSATGVETYYFNFTADKKSLDLATRENASSNNSIFQLNDLLHKAVLNAKVEESRDFAQKVQASLSLMSAKMNDRSRDRGIKQAPFVVLIGATMPSILAEVGFVSNPHDERLLKRGDQRQKIAQALYKGIFAYADSLSHLQMARAKSQSN
jgi:N-acetylmuramoyl-L-alanine amidase